MMEFHRIRFKRYLFFGFLKNTFHGHVFFGPSYSTCYNHLWICRHGQSCILQLVQFMSLRIIPWVELLHVSLHHDLCRLAVTKMTFFLLVLPCIEMCIQVSLWVISLLLQNHFACSENLSIASTPLGNFFLDHISGG